MTDIRLAASFPTHPKTKKLIKRLGQGGAWAAVCLFLWARGSRPDGDLSGMTDEDIELAADWSGDDGAFVGAMVAVGYLDGSAGEYQIHDWAEHQPWSAGADDRKQRAAWRALCKHHGRDGAAERMPEYAARMNKAGASDADSMDEASCDPATSMLVADGSMHNPATRSAPSPSPSPSPKAESKALGNGQAVAPPADPIPINPAAERQALRLAVVTRDAVETFNAAMSVQGCGMLSAVLLPDSDTRRSNVRRSLKVVRAICEKLYGKPEIRREFWKDYWDECARDPFKSGRGPYGNGHENWRPDFEYLTRVEVIEKTFNDSASQAA